MFPDPRKFVDDLASKLNPGAPSKDDATTNEIHDDDEAAKKPLLDFASKPSTPPPFVTDLTTKFKPPSRLGSRDDGQVLKDTTEAPPLTNDTVGLDSSSTATITTATPFTKKTKLAAKGWNIKMLPVKEHMIAGLLVPALRGGNLGLIQKKRRIILEILPAEDEQVNIESAARLQQVLDEGTTLLAPSGDEVVLNKDGAELKEGPVVLDDGATIVLRCMKVVKKGFFAKDSDLEDDNEEDDDGDPDCEWKEYRRYTFDLVQHQKTQGTYVEFRLGAGSDTVVRDFAFSSEDEAKQFIRTLEALKTLEVDRAQRQIKAYQQELQASAIKSNKTSIATVDPEKESNLTRGEADVATASVSTGDNTIQLLIEIVSGLNLPVGDIFSCDPYVVVRMGNRELHRTDFIPHTSDPIWTLQTGSLFLLTMTPEEFFASTGGMSFMIKDFDALGFDDTLGRTTIRLQDLLKGRGERVELDVIPTVEPKKKLEDKKKGKLVLRYKVASPEDVEFMEYFTAHKKNAGALADLCYLPPNVTSAKLWDFTTKTGPNKETQYRVKPGPDPLREEETTWMTGEQLKAESSKKSTNWIEVGSGNLGKIYIEILGCSNLTMDRAPIGPGSKINAVACLIFEDSIVNSDVINDEVNPKWMPWSQRAFMFHIRHPSSQLLLGVFNFDPFSPGVIVDNNAPIGRVALPLTNFCPRTNYTVQYPLFTGSGKKTANGTISLRFRIEWENERQALIASLNPRPPIYVSVVKKNDFLAAYYTAEGKMGQVTTFSADVFSSYIQELSAYQVIIDYILAAATTVFLWRGTLKVGSVLLPLHSMIAFMWGVLLTQDFNRLPSFWLFSIAWFFLASMEHVRSHPSKWHHCRSFVELFQILALSKSFSQEIAINDNLLAIEAHEAAEAERELKASAKAELEKKRKKEEEALLKEDTAAANAADVEVTAVKKAAIAINPLGFLFPIQKQVESAVVILRIIKSIVLWQENFLAFWLVVICLLGSFLLWWVPFGFILLWTLRVAAWATLGPWMKLVDIYYVQPSEQQGEDVTKNLEVHRSQPTEVATSKYYIEPAEQQGEDIRKSLEVRRDQLTKLATSKQINRERAQKLKDMTKYLFGNYLFRVPRFKEDRFPNYPLPALIAIPKPSLDGEVEFSRRIFGQHLSGDMVPKLNVKFHKDALPKNGGLLDPAAMPLLESFKSKLDYGTVRKTEGPLSFLFGLVETKK